MVVLSAHQPCYLPWMGYLNKIVNSDIFVLLDSVQYEKGSYINRVQIKTAQGSHWLTIPVPRDSYKLPINKVVVNDFDWREKQDKTVMQSYARAPFFYKCRFGDKVDCFHWRERISGWQPTLMPWITDDLFHMPIGNNTRVEYQSWSGVGGKKQDLIINLCKHYNADAFLFGIKGRDYVDIEYFKSQGIEPLFQDFKCIEYPQQWGGPFIPGLSVIDALFNVGAEKTLDLIKGGYSVR